MTPPLLTTQTNQQISDTRSLALSSYVASLEHAEARRAGASSQPQQPKQGTTKQITWP